MFARHSFQALLLMTTLAASGCAAQPAQEEDGAASEAAATATARPKDESKTDDETDVGGGWTKKSLGASTRIAPACKEKAGDEPCASRFRGHFVAAHDRGVEVKRGNSGRYYLHGKSESTRLYIDSDLIDENATGSDNGRSMWVGGTFSVTAAKHYFGEGDERCVHISMGIGINITNKGFPARHFFNTDVCESDMGKRIQYRLPDAAEATEVTIDWGS